MTESQAQQMRRTPLYEEHLALGAKMTNFHGWQLPVFYPLGSLKEHTHCRNHCGVFDVSHMAQIEARGECSEDFLQYVLPSDVSVLQEGRGRYSCMLGEEGGIIDDIFLYRLAQRHYLLCVNGARRQRVMEHLRQHRERWCEKGAAGELILEDRSDHWALLALQGPRSSEALELFLKDSELEKAQQLPYAHITCLRSRRGWLARTGYTGERGYEVFVPSSGAGQLWRELIRDNSWVQPMGLGARDSLRLEAGFLLYGADIHEGLSPYEVGLDWLISARKQHFVGCSALQRYRGENGEMPHHALVGFIMQQRTIPRSGMDVLVQNGEGNISAAKVGVVSSGGFLPTLGESGGLALMKFGGRGAVSSDADYAQRSLPGGRRSLKDVYLGRQIFIDVRGKKREARCVSLPFYVSRAR